MSALRRKLSVQTCILALALGFGSAASAQTAPGAAELAGYTGAFRAVVDNDMASLRRELKDPKTLRQTDSNGRTPLHVATFLKRREIIRELIARKADTASLDRQKYDPVTIAAVADDPQTLKVLLENGASAKLITSVYDGTALIAAAHLGHEECVRLLIEQGAPLDHVNNLGWTALMESIVLGDGGKRHQRTLDYLLKAGANANIPDRQGATPLAHARAKGYAAMIARLESSGAK